MMDPNPTPNIPVQTTQQPFTSPNPKPTPKFIFIFGGLIILFIGLFVGYYLTKSSVTEKPISKLPVNTPQITVIQPSPTSDPTANWKIYTNPKTFYPQTIIKYPKDWRYEIERAHGTADIVVIFYNSKNIYSATLIISANNFLRDFYELQKQYLGPLERTVVNNLDSYKMRDKFNYIEAYYFPKENGYASVELQNAAEKEAFNQILSTFRFD